MSGTSKSGSFEEKTIEEEIAWQDLCQAIDAYLIEIYKATGLEKCINNGNIKDIEARIFAEVIVKVKSEVNGYIYRQAESSLRKLRYLKGG
jgi:hypothetical protein